MGKEQPFERGITCSARSIDHEATTSKSGGSSHRNIASPRKEIDDLVYILEYFAENDFLPYEMIFELYLKVLSLKKEVDQLSKINEIKTNIKEQWEKVK